MSTVPARKMTTAQAISTGVGIMVGVYASINIVLPGTFAAVTWWAARKVLPDTRHSVLPAVAVHVGHGLWISLGLIILGTLNTNIIDPVIMIGGVLWLAMRPSNGPIYLLAVYQIIAVAVNAPAFLGADFGTAAHKALLVHLSLRIYALVVLTQLWLQFRRDTKAAAPDAGS